MSRKTGAAGSPGPLVGRARELSTLTAHAGAAGEGRAGLVLVSGPAGIGKTSLLRAFADSDPCREATVLYGSCPEVAARASYRGVRALFAPLDLAGTDSRGRPLLSGSARHALPALASGAAGDQPCASSSYSVLYGLYWLAANLMADRPLVLVLDDAHWCDEHSLRWLDFLLRRSDGLPLLVVLAQRTEEEPAAPAALADIAAQRLATTMSLGPLDEPEIGEMTRRMFAVPAVPRFVERVTAVSGGNPLTLVRLLHELRAEGALPDEAGIRRVDEVGGKAVALSVRELLDRGPAPVRDVATALAVLGEGTPYDTAALAGVSRAVVDDAVAVLRRAEVVLPDRMGFVHALVRAAVLDAVEPAALAGLRTRAARLLSDSGRPAEEVAGQLMMLPRVTEPWMAAVLRDAAALAGHRGAPRAAARYLRRVLEAEPDSVPVRIELAGALAEIDPPEAVRLLRQALDLAEDARTRAAVAVRHGMICLTVQQSPAAVRILETVLAECEAEFGTDAGPADSELLRLVESTLLLVSCDEKSTLGLARDRAARIPVPPGDTPAQRQTLAIMTILSSLDGTSAGRTAESARRVLRNEGATPAFWSAFVAAKELYLADRIEESTAALDLLLRTGQENATPWTYVLALTLRAVVLHGVGAVPDAAAAAQTAFDIIGEEKWGANMTMPQSALAVALVERGEPERAERVLATVRRSGVERFVFESHWYLQAAARVRAALGDTPGAIRLLLDCGASLEEAGIRNPMFVPWWIQACCLLAAENRHDEAAEIAGRGAERARRWGTPRALGFAALAEGVSSPDVNRGAELLTEAAVRLSTAPARVWHARAEHLLGRTLLTAGDARAARDHLRTAVHLARRCGALALAQEARESLVLAGGRMGRITPLPVDMLTGTERQIALLAAEGAGNREIAESLFVTVRTVETHLTSVYRKLGVAQRSELGAMLRTTEEPGRSEPATPTGAGAAGQR